MRLTQDFNKDYEVLTRRIAAAIEAPSSHRFALSRFADGELAFCAGFKKHRTADGWKYNGGDTPFALAMREAISADMDGMYYGVSCPCCDPKGHAWYMANMRTPPARITFSNIFVNANYARFKEFANRVSLRDRVVLVGCTDAADIRIPVNAINPPFDYAPTIDAMERADKPILVAGGPMSCVLIHRYWVRCGRRAVVDIGSALDPEIRNKNSRGYHRGAPTARKVCRWSTSPES